jgi:hypothetical protein
MVGYDFVLHESAEEVTIEGLRSAWDWICVEH